MCVFLQYEFSAGAKTLEHYTEVCAITRRKRHNITGSQCILELVKFTSMQHTKR